jgi:hypothetical protein
MMLMSGVGTAAAIKSLSGLEPPGLHCSNVPRPPARSGSRGRLAFLLALLLGLTGLWLCVPSGWAGEKKPALHILRVVDAPDPFSPNQDGRKDIATIQIEVGLFKRFGRRDVLEVTTVLRSPTGERVRTLKTRQALRESFPKKDEEHDAEGNDDDKDRDEKKLPQVLLIEQTWDGRDKAGQLVPDGTYAYTVRARVFRIKKEDKRERDRHEKDDGDKDDRDDKRERGEERARATPVAGSITLDVTPPTILATVDTPANAAGWHNRPVTVRFTCTDTGSGIAACEPDQVVTTGGVNLVITGTVVDVAGNIATGVNIFSVDPVPPELVITSPADGPVLSASTVTVTGTVTDDLSGVTLTVNGAPVNVPSGGGSFSHLLTLQEDPNTFTFVARDGAGNTRERLLCVTRQLPRYPFPQHVVYAPGTIRPDHRSQVEQDNDVRAFYDDWKAKFLVAAGATPAGHPLYRVAFGLPGSHDHDKTVSEGQGYGMVIVALMAGHDPCAQATFDGLWEFSRAHHSEINDRLMGWTFPPDPEGNDSAFDGDADIAYGLLLADKQWGSEGRVNYLQEARTVIAAILQSTIGPVSRLPMLGDWVNPNGPVRNQYTPRSSDFILGHFRAYGRATADVTWSEVVTNSQAVIASLQANWSPITGLLPDFIVATPPFSPLTDTFTDYTPQPAPPDFLEGPHDGHYDYNAGRVPWRLGTDALLNDDPVTLAQVRKTSLWAKGAALGHPRPDPLVPGSGIWPGYLLNGNPSRPNNYFFTTFFAAPLGVAAMTNPPPDPFEQTSHQTWLNRIYDAVSTRHEDYYEDSVTLLSLLVMTGNFWDPTTIGGP